MSQNISEHKIILFDTTAWLSNSKLKLAPYTIKGVWIDLMSHMANSDRYGYLIVAGEALSKSDIKDLLNFKTEEEFEKVWKILVDKYKILKFDTTANAYFSSRMVTDYNKHHLKIQYEFQGAPKAEIQSKSHQLPLMPVAEVKKQPAVREITYQEPKVFTPPTIEQIHKLFTDIKKEEGEKAKYNIDEVTKQFFKTYSEKNWIVRKLPPTNIKEECRKYVFKTFLVDEEVQIFDMARKAYPGMKNGLLSEFAIFRKQKDYKVALPLLLPAIQKQIKWRDKMKTIKGQFVPEWKFFTTWINQRCWEQEMPKIDLSKISDNDGPIKAK